MQQRPDLKHCRYAPAICRCAFSLLTMIDRLVAHGQIFRPCYAEFEALVGHFVDVGAATSVHYKEMYLSQEELEGMAVQCDCVNCFALDLTLSIHV